MSFLINMSYLLSLMGNMNKDPTSLPRTMDAVENSMSNIEALVTPSSPTTEPWWKSLENQWAVDIEPDDLDQLVNSTKKLYLRRSGAVDIEPDDLDQLVNSMEKLSLGHSGAVDIEPDDLDQVVNSMEKLSLGHSAESEEDEDENDLKDKMSKAPNSETSQGNLPRTASTMTPSPQPVVSENIEEVSTQSASAASPRAERAQARSSRAVSSQAESSQMVSPKKVFSETVFYDKDRYKDLHLRTRVFFHSGSSGTTPVRGVISDYLVRTDARTRGIVNADFDGEVKLLPMQRTEGYKWRENARRYRETWAAAWARMDRWVRVEVTERWSDREDKYVTVGPRKDEGEEVDDGLVVKGTRKKLYKNVRASEVTVIPSADNDEYKDKLVRFRTGLQTFRNAYAGKQAIVTHYLDTSKKELTGRWTNRGWRSDYEQWKKEGSRWVRARVVERMESNGQRVLGKKVEVPTSVIMKEDEEE